jgi:glyoxylase-like metal-dependent hydrolase (beta-lactamase superfamily II)
VQAAAGPVEQILLTHGHADHRAGAGALRELTGAPVRAADPSWCAGGEPLADGAAVAAGGLQLRVWTTPGHTADSLCFLLGPGDGAAAAVCTGDTILGRGTTVVADPDGNLADYLASLARLRDLGAVAALPGHGPELPSVGEVATAYLAHRRERLDQIRAALAALGRDASPQAVVAYVYADVDRVLWPAAEQSVRAQLAYLRERA